MNFEELANIRYSCRKYLDKKVEKEKLDKILNVARIAPTAANRQPQRLLIIESEEGLNKVKKAANIHGGPLCIMVCSDLNRVWENPYSKKKTTDVDASIITTYMMMEAADLGINSVYMTLFDEAVLREEFSVPNNYEIVNLLVLGYSADEQAPSADRYHEKRIPLQETVFYESYTKK